MVILSEPSLSGEPPFFETWLLMCMPEEGKTLNPEHTCFRPEPGKVESLVALLNTSVCERFLLDLTLPQGRRLNTTGIAAL
ncbi:mediator of RNA polymerase II transcription subunit 24-like [Electrophorus electricus]|uniref:mediator of RNA polymerase II transcription subunit 24-like n=1 Tax=Electrophorus electricus TaxID=8005 RepID=UPI0015CFBD0C|nr:mediator of RNA polymerase II transcription subunit 24-like [Electrophorus electricus]